MIGRTLSHYRILEQIGAGGMGVVYRARDERLERDVALKVLPLGTLADEAARKRFRKEALALSKLNHPNIATVHDFDTQEGVDFLVMEYVAGETVGEKVGAGPLAEKEIARLAVQLVDGMAAAHAQGVIHRDLKPGNVRLTPDGRLKILDFGLAKLVHRTGEADLTESVAETQAMAGTLPYMAPEQLRGDPVDARSDLYAVGVVLYEMATGLRPYRDELHSRLADAILHQVPVPPRALNPRVSPELEWSVLKCLEKEPESRYQSATELAVDLRRLGTSASVSAVRFAAPARGMPRRGLATVSVATFALLLTLLAGWWIRLRGPVPSGTIKSLAVLPLDNLSGDPEQEYFADGMTDALIGDLSTVSTLRVISRRSVMQYKSARKPLAEIAKALGVEAVVEGTVLRAGDKVRITAQLLEAASDRHLWAGTYERDLRDVLALQSGVARLIAREVVSTLSPREEIRFTADRTVDPAAHEDYLMGRYFWNTRTEEGLTKAIGYFRRSVERDSTFASAYTAIANYYNALPFYARIPPAEAFPKAKEAALRALAIDESLAEAHAALAFVLAYYDWNWAAAEREFQRALALNPSDASVHHSYSRYLAATGRHEEAMAELKKAQNLDPLSLGLKANEGMVLYFAGKYDEAIEQLRKTLILDSTHAVAHWGLGMALEQKAMYPEAANEIQKAIDLGGRDPNFIASLGHVYLAQGKRGQARRLLEQLEEESKRSYVSPYHAAVLHAGLDEKEEAFEGLNQAARERSTLLVYLRKDPRLETLRSDPRFRELLRRLSLPE